MQSNGKGRASGMAVALVVALAGSALLQGCAVTTGRWVPDRAGITSHSMTSRFDQRLNMMYAEPGGGLASGSALHMPQSRPSGMFFFRY